MILRSLFCHKLHYNKRFFPKFDVYYVFSTIKYDVRKNKHVIIKVKLHILKI